MAAIDRSGRPHVNSHSFARSLAAAGGVTLLLLVFLLLTLGPPSAEGVGRTLGSLLIPALVAAVVVGLMARRSDRPWRWWKYFAMVTPLMVFVYLLAAVGRISA